MKKRLSVAILGTSAPHFPVKTAKRNYANCIDALKKRLDFNFLNTRRIITDTLSYEHELRRMKKRAPCALILVQGAFTWDNISVYLHQYFGKIPTILWALPEGDFSKGGFLETNSLCGAIMNNAAFHKLKIGNSFCYGRPDDEKAIEKIGRFIKRCQKQKRQLQKSTI